MAEYLADFDNFKWERDHLNKHVVYMQVKILLTYLINSQMSILVSKIHIKATVGNY